MRIPKLGLFLLTGKFWYLRHPPSSMHSRVPGLLAAKGVALSAVHITGGDHAHIAPVPGKDHKQVATTIGLPKQLVFTFFNPAHLLRLVNEALFHFEGIDSMLDNDFLYDPIEPFESFN